VQEPESMLSPTVAPINYFDSQLLALTENPTDTLFLGNAIGNVSIYYYCALWDQNKCI